MFLEIWVDSNIRIL